MIFIGVGCGDKEDVVSDATVVFLDVRSEVFSDDIEKTYEEFEDFVEDIEKLK